MIIIATLEIFYEGKNITQDISPFITAFTLTDNAGAKADDLSLTLEDRESLWLTHWMPSKSDMIAVTVIDEDGKSAHGWPAFRVDEIDYTIPPHSITIKAKSVSIKSSLQYEQHNRAWENITLETVANDIAQSHGLELFYDAEEIFIERREQIHSADLRFLETLCDSFGLNVKVSDNKLIIYSQNDYDSHDSIMTISPDYDRLISVKFSSKSAKIYRKARVTYHQPVKNETYEAEYEDNDEEGSEEELEIYQHVDNQAQAESVAKDMLKKSNSAEITAILTLKGSVYYMAGVNITLDNFGMFSGKYFVENVTHSVTNSGYTVAMTLKMGAGSKSALKQRKAKSQGKKSSGGEILADDSFGY